MCESEIGSKKEGKGGKRKAEPSEQERREQETKDRERDTERENRYLLPRCRIPVIKRRFLAFCAPAASAHTTASPTTANVGWV